MPRRPAGPLLRNADWRGLLDEDRLGAERALRAEGPFVDCRADAGLLMLDFFLPERTSSVAEVTVHEANRMADVITVRTVFISGLQD